MNYETLYNTIQAYAENTEQLFVANIPVFVMEAEDRIYNAVQIPTLRKNVTGTLTAGNQYLALPTDYLSTYSIAVIDGSGNYTFLLNKDVNYLRQAFPSTVTTSGVQQGTPQSLPSYYALFGSQNGYTGANIDDLTLMLAPTPDSNYQVEMHYFYYPPTIVQGYITTLGTISSGAGYTNGIYQNVPLSYAQTSGYNNAGSNATADIVVSGGSITSVTVTFGGNFYAVGDILTCTALGSYSNAFSVPVATISNANGRSWLGDNYDPVLLYGAMREAMLFMKGEADLVKYYEDKYTEALSQLNRLGTGLERGDAYRDGQARLRVNP